VGCTVAGHDERPDVLSRRLGWLGSGAPDPGNAISSIVPGQRHGLVRSPRHTPTIARQVPAEQGDPKSVTGSPPGHPPKATLAPSRLPRRRRP
jgi:hypothetical protein